MSNEQHAQAFDLPGWPCPPRVRDISKHVASWGWVLVSASPGMGAIAQDELGYLWADGQAVPQFRFFSSTDENPGAILCWTGSGLGVYVHPKSLKNLLSISRLDMEPERWVPIAVALTELPGSIKEG